MVVRLCGCVVQEIFTATMMGALEWGLFDYAKGVLDNWLTYFIKDDGFVLYRGLEMAEHGRMLTNIAQYYQYTGDGEMLLKHLDKIAGIGWLLNQRRERSLTNYPPTDSRYGMPTGEPDCKHNRPFTHICLVRSSFELPC